MFTGCATNYRSIEMNVNQATVDRIVAEYNPVLEKGFCFDTEKGIYNSLLGGPFWSEMPLCRKASIVMHTHPVWGEPWASIIDEAGWDEYTSLYGNDTFGIVGVGWIRFYRREPLK